MALDSPPRGPRNRPEVIQKPPVAGRSPPQSDGSRAESACDSENLYRPNSPATHHIEPRLRSLFPERTEGHRGKGAVGLRVSDLHCAGRRLPSNLTSSASALTAALQSVQKKLLGVVEDSIVLQRCLQSHEHWAISQVKGGRLQRHSPKRTSGSPPPFFLPQGV